MAKKRLGKLVVVAAAAGAAAAGISYLKKYKSFNDELEEEFHDFEGEDDDEDDLFEDEETVIIQEDTEESKKPAAAEDEVPEDEPKEGEKAEDAADTRASRKYIPLNASKDEFKLAAKDMLTAAGEIAGATKNVLKDAAVILSDTAHEAAIVAKDTAQIARAKINERAEIYRSRQNEDTGTAQDKEAAPETPVQEDPSGAPEESAAAHFVPNEPAGAASLDTDTDDSILEVVNPEDAQKIVLENESTTTIEEIDDLK